MTMKEKQEMLKKINESLGKKQSILICNTCDDYNYIVIDREYLSPDEMREGIYYN